VWRSKDDCDMTGSRPLALLCAEQLHCPYIIANERNP
jgi:hypothetical protein